ncbi:MAG: (Fe-S)-binding protein [Bryobacteraceae bacterium]
MRLSGLELGLFPTLLAISVSLFAWRLGAVLGRVRRSKPDADFHLMPLLPRVRKFVWEVLLQAKVIRERPWPGIAHAFVFWGFCAFALVTLNHVSEAFGWPLLSPHGFGRFYRGVAAAFAVAVAVSIAGLAARRFMVRPKWLGEVSYESGLIAFLISALMATYLAQFGLAQGSASARANWWLHTLALLIFLPVIPHTKHLHLLLSPLTVFLSRRGFSRIPPLQGDEDFGLIAGQDVTRITSLQVYTCVECGRCTEHCPANLTGKILDPKQIVLGTRRYLEECGPRDSQPLLGKHLPMEAAFQCTTCGACEYQCPVGIQHLPLIVGLRRGAVNTGQWEDAYGTKLFLNLERTGNALGFPASERDQFIQKHALPIFDGQQEYCLWLGCMGSYDPQGREIVLALAEVLRYLGIGFGVLRKEKCNGEPARRLGNDLLFSTLAEDNLAEIRRSGVRKMLSICPHCVRTMKEDWKEFGAELEIEHHSELLARFAAQLPEPGGQRSSVVFHDACYLGRYRGIFDQPRAVVSRLSRLVNPSRAHQRGFCCGAGGGRFFLGEETGKRVSVARAEELLATGAEAVAAACPFCHSMLRDALATASPAPPPLLDIAQIAAQAIGGNHASQE